MTCNGYTVHTSSGRAQKRMVVNFLLAWFLRTGLCQRFSFHFLFQTHFSTYAASKTCAFRCSTILCKHFDSTPCRQTQRTATCTQLFIFCRRPLPFGGSPLEAYSWTSGESDHHRQSVRVVKNDALPTEPRGHLLQPARNALRAQPSAIVMSSTTTA